MLTLVLDTALNACSVAVSRDGDILAHASEPMQRGHQERLAPMVETVMRRSGVGFDALDRIGATIGPGSFTGLRVGLAFAKTLSLALDIPCVGVNSLEALAAGRTGFVVAAIAAKGDQLYLQAFLDGTSLMAPDVLDISVAAARVAELWSGDAATLVGSGAAQLAGVLEHFPQKWVRFCGQKMLPVFELEPFLSDLIDSIRSERALGSAALDEAETADICALAKLIEGRPSSAVRPRPLYLRAPDAKTIAERLAAQT